MTPLRQRMLEDMSIRNLTDNTEAVIHPTGRPLLQILSPIARFAGTQEVREYQVYLTMTRKLSASSISSDLCAALFVPVALKQHWSPDDIPMPKKPMKLPVVLSPEEVMHFLDCIENIKHRTLLMTAYAAGLRVSEATHLKVTDIDSQRMVILIDQGKGNKDRFVAFRPAA